MENDEMKNTELNSEDNISHTENQASETETAPVMEALPADVKEDTHNLDICPNCLEPNTDNLAVCKYCGMPLHQGADADEFLIKKESADLEANRREAVPEEKKPAKKQESGFRRVMPWLGLYLIYYAITGCFDISRQIKAAEAEGQAVNVPLAYGSQAIWFIAGVMMAWPLIKKGYRKLRGLPEPEEAEETAEETAAAETPEETETTEAADTDQPETMPETDGSTESESTVQNDAAPENENDSTEA